MSNKLKRLVLVVTAGVAVLAITLWMLMSVFSPEGRLVRATCNNNLSEVKKILSKDKGLLHRPMSGGVQPVHYAARSRSGTDVLEFFLNAGADPNARTATGSTPLMWAVTPRNDAAVLLLLRAKADPNAYNRAGNSVLEMAAWLGDVRAVRALISANARVNAKDHTKKRWTALHYAARFGKCRVIRELVVSHADINASSVDGTPLAVAVRHTQLNAVKCLLALGASTSRPNRRGSTPLHVAAQSGNLPAARALLLAHANPNAVDKRGWTPLQNAVGQSHRDVALLLLDAGADANHRSRDGATAEAIARISGDDDMVELLREYRR